MDIFTESKIIIFIIFVVPGFITTKFYELLFPIKEPDSTKKLLDAVAYSCINYAILSIPIYLLEVNKIYASQPTLYAIFWGFAVLVAPIVWVLIWQNIRKTNKIQRLIPHPVQKPWDFVFSTGKPYWVVVNLKNGKKIGGMYGPNSFASSAPAEEQIYLEEEWILNGDNGFERQADLTAGVLILSSEIQSLEFYNSGEDSDERSQP